MKRSIRVALAVLLAASVLATTGCLRRVRLEDQPGQAARNANRDLPLEQGAESIEARISMGAGLLELVAADLGGDALAGDFEYAPARFEPVLGSELDGSVQKVSVRHPDEMKVPFGENVESEWDLRLHSGVPTKLVVNMGAGESRLDLSTLDVTELKMNLGAGKSTIDLTGTDRKQDVKGEIIAGAGELLVRLPRNIPVRISGHQDGLGEWEAYGFTPEGNTLVNDAWKDPATDYKFRIDLAIRRGVGRVELDLVD